MERNPSIFNTGLDVARVNMVRAAVYDPKMVALSHGSGLQGNCSSPGKYRFNEEK